jgi:NAD(P)-dependent dehydrogenase (short-subunit alcohol dehydrogenase family)
MFSSTGIGASFIMRMETQQESVTFGQIATALNEVGGDIVAIDVNRAASDDAAYITGATLVIDGGNMANASEL